MTRAGFPTDRGAETEGWSNTTKRHREEREFWEVGTACAKALKCEGICPIKGAATRFVWVKVRGRVSRLEMSWTGSDPDAGWD